MAYPLRALADPAADSVRTIRAFHGSPYDFDRFDASKIGTGEGAHSFGHGLYFAENEGVARHYRDSLSPRTASVDGREDLKIPWFLPSQALDDMRALDSWRARWRDQIDNAVTDGQRRQWQEELAVMDAIADGAKVNNPGRMYEVEIGYPEESLLDWDASVNDQNLNVLGVFGNVRGQLHWPDAKAQYLGGHPDSDDAIRWNQAVMRSNPKGMDLWHAAHTLNNQDGAVKLMLQQGIPGIRYLDQGSRSVGQGTRNYVIFPGAEDRIRILRKYGLLAPMAAGAAMEQD